MKLARSATELTILDIANAVEPIERIKTCPLGISDHGTNLCPLHRRLDQTIAMVERTFAESTLADLVDDREGITPLCPFPRRQVLRGEG